MCFPTARQLCTRQRIFWALVYLIYLGSDLVFLQGFRLFDQLNAPVWTPYIFLLALHENLSRLHVVLVTLSRLLSACCLLGDRDKGRESLLLVGRPNKTAACWWALRSARVQECPEAVPPHPLLVGWPAVGEKLELVSSQLYVFVGTPKWKPSRVIRKFALKYLVSFANTRIHSGRRWIQY